MSKATPYLLFNGNCDAAFQLYRTAFQGEIASLIRYGELPVPAGQAPVAVADQQKIENIVLTVNDELLLMGADVIGIRAAPSPLGHRCTVYIEAASPTEAEHSFSILAEGGQIAMPLGIAHWGDFFGMLTDQFGVSWLINCRASLLTS